MIKLVLRFFVLVCMCSAVFAATQDENLQEGIRCHDQARMDPETNIEKGKALLAPMQKDSALAKAYYGSLITLEASEYAKKKNGIKALSLLSEGTKLIDEAVKMSPELPDLHFLRMINSYEVTTGSPLNRYKIMKQDIDWIEKKLDQFDAKNRGVFQLYKGLYNIKARKPDIALAAFDACIAVSPESPEAAEAKKQKERYAE